MFLRYFMFFLLALSANVSATTANQPNTADSEGKPELSSSQVESWKLLIGKWYGDQRKENGSRHQWLVSRFNDGTYRIHFLVTKTDGSFIKRTEVGQWGISGPVYFSIFRGTLDESGMRAVPTANPYNYDAYKIIKLTADTFEYEHFQNGRKFSVKRVPEDFHIPK